MNWELPNLRVEVVADHSPDGSAGFLRLRRRELRVRRGDGTVTATMLYDSVDRRATDAVVMVLHDGAQVLLRTAIRPPVAFRDELAVPEQGSLQPIDWELPAGLVEPDEVGAEGLLRAAVRETEEETGFVLSPDAFRPLGPPVYLCPGVIAERLYYYEAEVRRAERGRPSEDGSPMEEGAAVRFFDLRNALDHGIGDAKTELGLFRLWRQQETGS